MLQNIKARHIAVKPGATDAAFIVKPRTAPMLQNIKASHIAVRSH